MEDGKIIELLWERSEEGLNELSKKYGANCKRVAGNILNNPLDAEECVNDAFLAVWNTVPPQNPDPLSAYLYRVVRNQALKKYHANTAEKRNSVYDVAFEEIEDCIASSVSVEDETGAAEMTRKINAFLETLDKTGQIIFIRRYWYSDSIGEIAEYLQTNVNAVSIRLSRIRKKLAAFLKKEGVSI